MDISIKNKLVDKEKICCLPADEELLNRYHEDKGFVTKTCDESNTLIPQFWWENIKNPKIIILANNPSYKRHSNSGFSDDADNVNCREYLINNIYRPQGFNCDFIKENKESYFAHWWGEKFFENYEIDINEVAIFNLLGYYSKNSSFFNKDILQHSHMKQFANELKDYCQSNEDVIIVFVWKGSLDFWKRSLGKDIFIKMFDNKKVYIANKGHRFNPKLNGACRYFINENKYYESDLLNINELIKQLKKSSK